MSLWILLDYPQDDSAAGGRPSPAVRPSSPRPLSQETSQGSLREVAENPASCIQLNHAARGDTTL